MGKESPIHDAEFIVKSISTSNQFYTKYEVHWRYVEENRDTKMYAYDSHLNTQNTEQLKRHYRDKFKPRILVSFESNKTFSGLEISSRLYSRLREESRMAAKTRAESGKFTIGYRFRLVYEISCGGYPGDALEVYSRMSSNYKEHFINMIGILKSTAGLKLKVTGYASNIYNGEVNSNSKVGHKSNNELAKERQKEGVAFVKRKFSLSQTKIGLPGNSAITFRDKDGNDRNIDQSVWFELSDK